MKHICCNLFAIAMLVPSAHAVMVFEDDFNSYADQPAFEASWTTIGCQGNSVPASCVNGMTTPESNTLSQDFPERGNTLLNVSPVGTPGSADLADRNQRILGSPTSTLAVGDKLSFSLDFYDLTGTGNPYRQFVTLGSGTAPTGTGQLIGLGLNNNLLAPDQEGNYYMARILGGASNGGTASQYFKLNDEGAPLRSEGWHNLKVEISTSNGTNQDYRFFVDGTLSETVLNVGTSLRQYDFIKIGAGFSSTSDAYYDNIKLEHILAPPPGGLLGDFNEDDVVDASDYIIWRENDTANNPLPNDDGKLTQAERYTVWTANFGNTPPPASGAALGAAAVPEPATATLLLTLAALLAARRRR